MSDTKTQSLRVEDTKIPGDIHSHHVHQIDQGNNAVLLDIGIGDEKGDTSSIKLAKDGHVRNRSSPKIPDPPGADSMLDRIDSTAFGRS
jgi:hypothetical protein